MEASNLKDWAEIQLSVQCAECLATEWSERAQVHRIIQIKASDQNPKMDKIEHQTQSQSKQSRRSPTNLANVSVDFG
jgi:hypothetical protein